MCIWHLVFVVVVVVLMLQAEKIVRLKRELAEDRMVTERLCADLETPENTDRWRALEGEDPDEDQVGAGLHASERARVSVRCAFLTTSTSAPPLSCQQLIAKTQVLEERLNDKKEQLLEKELVLEEVTALSDKLRKQAAEGRGDTLQLAKKVNEFQARIKETTRKMMATVSEYVGRLLVKESLPPFRGANRMCVLCVCVWRLAGFRCTRRLP